MRRLLSVLFREILYFLATGPVQRQRQQRNDKRLIRAIEKLSDSYSQKIQRNMRLLLSIAVVCLITAADAKDAALLGTGEAIRLPVLGAPISFIAFFCRRSACDGYPSRLSPRHLWTLAASGEVYGATKW